MSAIHTVRVSAHTARELTLGEADGSVQLEASFGIHAELDALMCEYPDADVIIIHADGWTTIFE